MPSPIRIRDRREKRSAPPSPEQLGPPIAYLALKDGTPVYDRNGNRIGVVEHVMTGGSIFEGVIVHTHPLPGRHLYADATQIAGIFERGVLLSVEADELYEPRRQGRRRLDDPLSELERRVRRAFDWITGERP